MRTSLNDIRETEQYIEGKLSPGERLFFEAKLLTSALWRQNFYFQKKTYDVVREYHRRQLKQELEEVHHGLFTHPDKREFQKNIFQLFK